VTKKLLKLSQYEYFLRYEALLLSFLERLEDGRRGLTEDMQEEWRQEIRSTLPPHVLYGYEKDKLR
jgi:hypothetical protein